jgi:hypothetical protein
MQAFSVYAIRNKPKKKKTRAFVSKSGSVALRNMILPKAVTEEGTFILEKLRSLCGAT